MQATLNGTMTGQATETLAEQAQLLAKRFAEWAADHDEEDSFVMENYQLLHESGFFKAGVPVDLGGGGATFRELADALRIMATGCGSTALAASMHTHQVVVSTWRWIHDGAPLDGLLRRVVSENLVLISSGGSDWLDSSGRAERVEGGYQIFARKMFASGSPAGSLLMTSAVYDDPENGPTVLHFAVPFSSPQVRIEPTWHAHGMRGTASHDIVIEGHFLPDAAVSGRRPKGPWHRLFHIISQQAITLIYSVYLGVAEAARDLAVKRASGRRMDPLVQVAVGKMENQLAIARFAHEAMVRAAETQEPGPATTNLVMQGRSAVAAAVIATVEQAMEIAGGASFQRSVGIERLWRDVQGARFHPLRDDVQMTFAGRMALGVAIDD